MVGDADVGWYNKSELKFKKSSFAGGRKMSRVRTSRGVFEGDAGAFAVACGDSGLLTSLHSQLRSADEGSTILYTVGT